MIATPSALIPITLDNGTYNSDIASCFFAGLSEPDEPRHSLQLNE